jgi:Trp operon repressor
MKDERDGELISLYTDEEFAKIMVGLADYNRNVQEWLDILITPDERTEARRRDRIRRRGRRAGGA